MKKIICLYLSLIVTISLLSGCSGLEETSEYVEVNITENTWLNTNDDSTLKFNDDATVIFEDKNNKISLTGTFVEGESGTVGTLNIPDSTGNFVWNQYYIDSNGKLFLHDDFNTSYAFTKVVISGESEELEEEEEEVDTTLGGNVYYSGDVKLEFIEDDFAAITFVEGNVTEEGVTANLTTIEGEVKFDGNSFRFNDEKGTVHSNGTITMQGYDEPFALVDLN